MLDGNPPEVKTLYTSSGGNIVVDCSFTRSDSRKYFCRDDCKDEDILIETTSVEKVKKSRYSVEYVGGSSGEGSLFVSVSQLIASDSGRYRCGMGRPRSQVYKAFKVIVTDAEFLCFYSSLN